MTKPTEPEMTAIEKRVCYSHRTQEKGRVTPWMDTVGNTSQPEDRMSREDAGQSLDCVSKFSLYLLQGHLSLDLEPPR